MVDVEVGPDDGAGFEAVRDLTNHIRDDLLNVAGHSMQKLNAMDVNGAAAGWIIANAFSAATCDVLVKVVEDFEGAELTLEQKEHLHTSTVEYFRIQAQELLQEKMTILRVRDSEGDGQ